MGITRFHGNLLQHIGKKPVQLSVILIYFYAADHTPFPKCIQYQIQHILHFDMISDLNRRLILFGDVNSQSCQNEINGSNDLVEPSCLL